MRRRCRPRYRFDWEACCVLVRATERKRLAGLSGHSFWNACFVAFDATPLGDDMDARSAHHLGMIEAAACMAPIHECARVELVVALHTLASHYENAISVFRDDAEAFRKARGDIEHAMKIAAKHNQNRPDCEKKRDCQN